MCTFPSSIRIKDMYCLQTYINNTKTPETCHYASLWCFTYDNLLNIGYFLVTILMKSNFILLCNSLTFSSESSVTFITNTIVAPSFSIRKAFPIVACSIPCSIIWSYCSSDQRFAARFLQIPYRHGHPCVRLTATSAFAARNFHPIDCTMLGAQEKVCANFFGTHFLKIKND